MKKIILTFIISFFFIFELTHANSGNSNYFLRVLCSFGANNCLNNSLPKINFGNNFFPTFISNSFPQRNQLENQEENIFLTNSNQNYEITIDSDQKTENNTNSTNSESEEGKDKEDQQDKEKKEEEESKDESLLCKLGIFCEDKKLEEKKEEDEDDIKTIEEIERELALNPPEPEIGSSEYNTWGPSGESEQPVDFNTGQGYDQQEINHSHLLPPLTKESLNDFKITGIDKNCEPFGVINRASNINVRPVVKSDLARICSAFQRKITVVDAVRANRVFSNPCQPPSRHLSAEAVDFEINKYGTRQEQAMLIVAFIALGYNIGSYENNFPLHADRGQCSHWQTWSRWAHKNGKANLAYQQQVVDALSMMGIEARSAIEFNRNGRKSRAFMVERAREVIKNSGNQKLIEFLLPQESV